MVVRGLNLPVNLKKVTYRVSPGVSNDDLNDLFAISWPNNLSRRDFQPILSRSLSYICSYAYDDNLIGFVNLAWDGGAHAFLLDTTVHPEWRRHGIGRQLVLHAVRVARESGIDWLHVDYEPHLANFYQQCGFGPTLAGLISLQ